MMEKVLFLPKMKLKELSCYNKLKHLSQGAFLIPKNQKGSNVVKIECTPKEAADFIDELRSQPKKSNMTIKLGDSDLIALQEAVASVENTSHSPTVYFCDRSKNVECPHRNMCCVCDKTTLNRDYAKLDDCGHPFLVHHSAFLSAHTL